MTRTEALKELLKENLRELDRNTYIDGLVIDFKDDEFIVSNEDTKIIFKDKLSNYDLDFESQKRFVLKIADKSAGFVEVLEDVDRSGFFENLIEVDDEYYFDVLGRGDIYKGNYIEIDCAEIGSNDLCNLFVEYVTQEIKDHLDKNKIRVILYSDKYGYETGFYVNGVINEDQIYIGFIEDPFCLKHLENAKNIDEVIGYDAITLYYSLTSKKEVNDAVEFVKNLTHQIRKED